MLVEHDRTRVGTRRSRRESGQELVAGGDEVGDVCSGVGSAGSHDIGVHDIGVHGMQTAGERGADGGGVGARGHPEAGGRVHDVPIMASHWGR